MTHLTDLVTHGQRVRIQHCIGRYGQTRTVTGKVEFIDNYGGVVLDPGHDFTHYSDAYGGRRYVAGDSYYASLPRMTWNGERFEYTHNDFEHGHTCFLELL